MHARLNKLKICRVYAIYTAFIKAVSLQLEISISGLRATVGMSEFTLPVEQNWTEFWTSFITFIMPICVNCRLYCHIFYYLPDVFLLVQLTELSTFDPLIPRADARFI